MKKYKGMTVLLAAAVLMLMLAACGGDKKDADQKADPKPDKKTDATTQATDAAVVFFWRRETPRILPRRSRISRGRMSMR